MKINKWVYNIIVTPCVAIRVPLVLVTICVNWFALNFEKIVGRIPAWER